MLATRNTKKSVKRLSNVTLTDNDAFEPDTVSPHDKEGLKVVSENMGTQDRIPSLIRGAARSRDLCEVHRCTARESIRAAKSAKRAGNGTSYRDHLKIALDARRQAAECRQFARECEDRANALILAGCSHPTEIQPTQEALASDTGRNCLAEAIER